MMPASRPRPSLKSTPPTDRAHGVADRTSRVTQGVGDRTGRVTQGVGDRTSGVTHGLSGGSRGSANGLGQYRTVTTVPGPAAAATLMRVAAGTTLISPPTRTAAESDR